MDFPIKGRKKVYEAFSGTQNPEHCGGYHISFIYFYDGFCSRFSLETS
jgi:hypothetical protein